MLLQGVPADSNGGHGEGGWDSSDFSPKAVARGVGQFLHRQIDDDKPGVRKATVQLAEAISLLALHRRASREEAANAANAATAGGSSSGSSSGSGSSSSSGSGAGGGSRMTATLNAPALRVAEMMALVECCADRSVTVRKQAMIALHHIMQEAVERFSSGAITDRTSLVLAERAWLEGILPQVADAEQTVQVCVSVNSLFRGVNRLFLSLSPTRSRRCR